MLRTASAVAGMVSHLNVDQIWNGCNGFVGIHRIRLTEDGSYQEQTVQDGHRPQMHSVPGRRDGQRSGINMTSDAWDARERNGSRQDTLETGQCINKLVQGVEQIGCTSR